MTVVFIDEDIVWRAMLGICPPSGEGGAYFFVSLLVDMTGAQS